MKLCDYDCGKEGLYLFQNGKLCCSLKSSQCSTIRRKIKKSCSGLVRTNETKIRMSISQKGHYVSEETKNKIKEANKKRVISKKLRKKMGFGIRLSIKRIKVKYPLFSKIEEMRYNLNKPEEKEIQVHCKNHKCKNSKERGGWFTPSKSHISERIRQVEIGNGGSYFYCSKRCKNNCPLYRLRFDPYSSGNKYYTEYEYQTFRKFVLERDNYICQFCGEKATDVHHERPQKLESFFALDPDFGWSCCEKCHYEKGHKDECNTSILASIRCKKYSRID